METAVPNCEELFPIFRQKERGGGGGPFVKNMDRLTSSSTFSKTKGSV
jgi:hypothetical protein